MKVAVFLSCLLLLLTAPPTDALCAAGAGLWVRYIKFVMVQLGMYLEVAEVQFYVNGTNIALNKPTSALDFDPRFPPSNMVCIVRRPPALPAADMDR